MKGLHMTTWILIIVGAINWGLLGLFGWNAVHSVLGSWMGIERLVYILVGVSAVVEIVTHAKNCKMCGK